MTTSFFERDGDYWVGADAARGPWAPDACHAGPVAGAIAGVIEAAEPERQLTRLTITYQRPVPMDGFTLRTTAQGGGRSAATVNAELMDRRQRICAVANGLLLTPEALSPVPTASMPSPDLKASHEAPFPLGDAPHGLSFFGNGVDVRLPDGEDGSPGPGTIWMKTPAIVAGEAMSPFQSICPLADCANGFSRNADSRELTFINPDLTILIHRLPESAWLASRGYSFWESNGIGATQATLFDTEGVIGTALQSLVIREVG